jgi:hypothetical protein
VVVGVFQYPKWRLTVVRKFPKPDVKRVAYGLNTVNLGRFYAGIFTTVENSGVRTVTLIDINNTSIAGVVVKEGVRKYGPTASLWQSDVGSIAYDDIRVFARLGTGSASPLRTNSNLQSPVAGEIILTGSYNDGDIVTLTGTGNYGTPFSPSEVGVFMEGGGGSTNVKRVYMIDRAVFTPLPTGTTFTVRVDIPLG